MCIFIFLSFCYVYVYIFFMSLCLYHHNCHYVYMTVTISVTGKTVLQMLFYLIINISIHVSSSSSRGSNPRQLLQPIHRVHTIKCAWPIDSCYIKSTWQHASMTSWTHTVMYSVYCCVCIGGSRRRFDPKDELNETWMYMFMFDIK